MGFNSQLLCASSNLSTGLLLMGVLFIDILHELTARVYKCSASIETQMCELEEDT